MVDHAKARLRALDRFKNVGQKPDEACVLSPHSFSRRSPSLTTFLAFVASAVTANWTSRLPARARHPKRPKARTCLSLGSRPSLRHRPRLPQNGQLKAPPSFDPPTRSKPDPPKASQFDPPKRVQSERLVEGEVFGGFDRLMHVFFCLHACSPLATRAYAHQKFLKRHHVHPSFSCDLASRRASCTRSRAAGRRGGRRPWAGPASCRRRSARPP